MGNLLTDPDYHAIRDNLAMDPTKSFLNSLTAVDQHTTMFISTKNSRSNRRANPANKREKEKKEKKEKDRRKANAAKQDDKEKGEKLPGIEQDVWNKLPDAVKKHIAEHNRKIRGKKGGNNRNGEDEEEEAPPPR